LSVAKLSSLCVRGITCLVDRSFSNIRIATAKRQNRQQSPTVPRSARNRWRRHGGQTMGGRCAAWRLPAWRKLRYLVATVAALTVEETATTG
jgi:hypothetical protein